MTALIDAYDVALFDLDGVVYRGPDPVPGAVEGIERLHARGVRTLYVTNNAAPPARSIVDKLVGLGFDAGLADLVTSAQAVAALMGRELRPGARVLVAGSQNLVDLVRGAGFVVVPTADDQPDAVVQGYDPTLAWSRLDEAAIAVQRGARWYATNLDMSRPTERGVVPGVGPAVLAVQGTTRVRPIVTGKPFRPMLEEALRRSAARTPILVGDRLDTDVAGAHAVGIDSCLVLTGVHGKRDLVEAAEGFRPTAIAWDIPGLLLPERALVNDADGLRCRGVHVASAGGVARIDGDLGDQESQLDGLWCLARLVWDGRASDYAAALGQLNAVH